ncbi:MAG: 4'-phosphopantetheinyl transferase superfamily protein [Bacteroidetes bacterium]|nr:4'-phosphopantetheinyl transferase superfamily protein [Bacteroidota bacterium]
MPLDYQIKSEKFSLAIWQMDESLEELQGHLNLSAGDSDTLNHFKSEYRKREWLTTRVLVKKLLSSKEEVRIDYQPNGKPFLIESDYSISISHTKNYVSVLLSKSGAAGIDLETIQPRIEKISKKFVTADEEKFIEKEKRITYQHVIWGTKEVLFKIYGDGNLNFLEHLHVDKFVLNDCGELTGSIIKGTFRNDYRVFYERRDSLMLVYSVG